MVTKCLTISTHEESKYRQNHLKCCQHQTHVELLTTQTCQNIGEVNGFLADDQADSLSWLQCLPLSHYMRCHDVLVLLACGLHYKQRISYSKMHLMAFQACE